MKPPDSQGTLRARYNDAMAVSRSLCDPLAEALQALEFGETLQILEAVKDGRKRQFRELRLQLWALCFLEYKQVLGGRKNKLLSEVGEAFGVSLSTVRGWDRQLRKQLDPFYVANALFRARRCGEADHDNNSERFDRLFGKAALLKWGAEYKDVQGFTKPKSD